MRNRIPIFSISLKAAGTCLAILIFLAACISNAHAYSCASSMAPDQTTGNTEIQNSYNSWKAAYVTTSGAGSFLRVPARRRR